MVVCRVCGCVVPRRRVGACRLCAAGVFCPQPMCVAGVWWRCCRVVCVAGVGPGRVSCSPCAGAVAGSRCGAWRGHAVMGWSRWFTVCGWWCATGGVAPGRWWLLLVVGCWLCAAAVPPPWCCRVLRAAGGVFAAAGGCCRDLRRNRAVPCGGTGRPAPHTLAGPGSNHRQTTTGGHYRSPATNAPRRPAGRTRSGTNNITPHPRRASRPRRADAPGRPPRG